MPNLTFDKKIVGSVHYITCKRIYYRKFRLLKIKKRTQVWIANKEVERITNRFCLSNPILFQETHCAQIIYATIDFIVQTFWPLNTYYASKCQLASHFNTFVLFPPFVQMLFICFIYFSFILSTKTFNNSDLKFPLPFRK